MNETQIPRGAYAICQRVSENQAVIEIKLSRQNHRSAIATAQLLAKLLACLVANHAVRVHACLNSSRG